MQTPADIASVSVPQRVLTRLWVFVALAVLLLEVARTAFWFVHADAAQLPGWASLLPALARGGRYDLAVACGWALAVLLSTLPFCLLPRRLREFAPRTASALCMLLLVAFALLSICESYYYGFYHTRFDPVVFGLFEDDTGAVLATAWHDYPVLRWLLALLLGGVAAACAFSWTLARLPGLRASARPVRIALIAAQVLLLALLARGSLGTFPLVRQDVVFSPDPFVNQLVLNAPLTLYKAVRVRQKQIVIGDDPSEGLQALGFRDVRQAAAIAGLPGGSEAQIAGQLFATAPGVPSTTRPNVVLALLESFGSDLLRADGPRNDLLGRLRPHLAHDYVFANFISGQNGTHPELENLLLGSPITPLTQGEAGRIPLPTSAALPFKRAGYRTVFIYAGGADWRGIGKVFKQQGFDEFFDARDIRARYPDARATAWGVYDEYVFRFAREQLERAGQQPVFLFLLTTTNHPPYTLDTPHRALPLEPAALGPRGNPDLALRRKILATYQYQADQFGAFLDGIEQGTAGANTIVAAAGDHNLRDHYIYSLPAEQADVDRVFGFFRLPPSLRPAQVDTARFAGHKDLLPTLVSLALPGARYFDTGTNLFAAPQANDYGLAMFNRVYLRDGVAFDLAQPQWHAWTQPFARISAQGGAMPPQAATDVRRIAAGVALRDWYLRTQVLQARRKRE